MKPFCRVMAVVVLLGLLFAGQSQAQPYEVVFVNATGDVISEFYASSAASEYWEDDLLHGQTLAPGEEFVVTFMDPDPVYDVRLELPRRQWIEYSDINIRDNRRVILHP